MIHVDISVAFKLAAEQLVHHPAGYLGLAHRAGRCKNSNPECIQACWEIPTLRPVRALGLFSPVRSHTTSNKPTDLLEQ